MATLGPDDFRFKHPMNLLVVGPTQAGKSSWVKQLLLHGKKLVNVEFSSIHWICAQETDVTRELRVLFPGINIWKGLPQDLDLFLKPIGKDSVIVIDDLQKEIANHDEISELFIRQGHHLGISVILLVHNLFFPGRDRVTINRNATYVALFKSPLDAQPVHILGQRLLPGEGKVFVKIFTKATKDPHSCLVIDGSQDCPDICRFRSHIYGGYQRVYIPRSWAIEAGVEML